MTSKTKKVIKEVVEWILWLGSAVLVALFLNYHIIINSDVVSGSMETTIMTGDRVIGFRTAYWFKDPKRGDIIIFNHPESPESEKLLIKRVIGLPGDTVEIRDGKVFVNGEELEEDYLKAAMRVADAQTFEVPEDCYFVMGDNRNGSFDSRYWSDPYVKREDIRARAGFIYYPKIEKVK